jgi:hypothetical protein
MYIGGPSDPLSPLENSEKNKQKNTVILVLGTKITVLGQCEQFQEQVLTKPPEGPPYITSKIRNLGSRLSKNYFIYLFFFHIKMNRKPLSDITNRITNILPAKKAAKKGSPPPQRLSPSPPRLSPSPPKKSPKKSPKKKSPPKKAAKKSPKKKPLYFR